MNFEELVRESRSCRRFRQDPRLSIDDLESLVNLARMAPSARNAQELRFALATSASLIAEIMPHIRWAKVNGQPWAPARHEWPTGFIAIIQPEKKNELLLYDAGIACQTMQLGAAAKGWGACIIGLSIAS